MMRRGRSDGRRLATVLFTDMVGSTERAIELGDRAWRSVLRSHHRAVRAELRRYGGHEVDSAGDGFFATFPQPAQAVRCALAIHAAVRPMGLSMRSGIHAGEVEPIGQKVGGVAVHLAARVLSAAEPGEILATSTVRDLVAGSELSLADAGTRMFKGFSEPWHVYRVTGPEPAQTHRDDERPPERDVRQRRTTYALGGVLGAGLVVAVLVLLGLTGSRPDVVAGPNTVVLIEGENRLDRAVSVARAPSALATDAGALWVASEAGTITRIGLDDEVQQVVGGVGIPTAMALADGTAWILAGFEGRLSRVDGETVELRDSVEIRARSVAAAGTGIWLTDDIADRVIRLSPLTLGEDGSAELDAGSGPRAVAIAGTDIWVANERSATLVRIDGQTAQATGTGIGLGAPPTDLAIGAGSAWVTSMATDTLLRVDLERGEVLAAIDMCDEPDAVVASGEGVWVACRAGRAVRRLDADGAFIVDIHVPGVPSALALAEDGVWVALRSD
jgi:class 3 adenylate cyclase